MARKKLNIDGIANELQGASAFFREPERPLPSSAESAPISETPEPVLSPNDVISNTTQAEPVRPEQRGSVSVNSAPDTKGHEVPVTEAKESHIPASGIASKQSREQASMLASNQDSVLAKVRRTIREIGREVSYTRLTPEEKRRIMDTIYFFRSNDGIKTTETELMRISVNILLEDYDLRKEQSLLYKILHQ